MLLSGCSALDGVNHKKKKIHPNGDVNRLNIPGSEGGGRLKSIVHMYESGIVAVVQI